MPDDSSKEQRALQQAHSAKIAAERHVMDSLGLTREQVRARLRGFSDRSARAREEFVPISKQQSPPEPVLEGPTRMNRALDSQPLSLNGQQNKGQNVHPSQVGGSIPDIIVIIDGDPKITDLLTTGRLDDP